MLSRLGPPSLPRLNGNSEGGCGGRAPERPADFTWQVTKRPSAAQLPVAGRYSSRRHPKVKAMQLILLPLPFSPTLLKINSGYQCVHWELQPRGQPGQFPLCLICKKDDGIPSLDHPFVVPLAERISSLLFLYGVRPPHPIFSVMR